MACGTFLRRRPATLLAEDADDAPMSEAFLQVMEAEMELYASLLGLTKLASEDPRMRVRLLFVCHFLLSFHGAYARVRLGRAFSLCFHSKSASRIP